MKGNKERRQHILGPRYVYNIFLEMHNQYVDMSRHLSLLSNVCDSERILT